MIKKYTHIIFSCIRWYIPSDSRSSTEEFPASEVLVRIGDDREGGNEAASSSAIDQMVHLCEQIICNYCEHESEWWKSWKYLQAVMWKLYLPDYVT
jgi:hypothetical protein